jgi:hypothetical protein
MSLFRMDILPMVELRAKPGHATIVPLATERAEQSFDRKRKFLG